MGNFLVKSQILKVKSQKLKVERAAAHYAFVFAFAFAFTACGDADVTGLIAGTSEGVEKRAEYSLSWNEANGFQTIISSQDDYQLCIVGDTHFGTSENFAKVEAVAENSTLAIVVVGDISTGKKDDYQKAAELFANSTSKIIPVIGNHDLYFGGWQYFKEYFGSSMYYFEVQTPAAKDLHICLDSGNGTLGKTQTNWLKDVFSTKRANYRHCFVYSHTNMYRSNWSQSPSSNMPLEETYRLMDLFSKNRVNAVIMAHDHSREEIVFNKVQYITLDALLDGAKNASYVIMTVDKGFAYQFNLIAE